MLIVDRILFYGFGILSVVESQRAGMEREDCILWDVDPNLCPSLSVTMKMYGLSLSPVAALVLAR